MTYIIPIVTNDGQINSAFVKANAEIITTYAEKFNQQSTVELKIQLLDLITELQIYELIYHMIILN
jgi:hypothetical protein